MPPLFGSLLVAAVLTKIKIPLKLRRSCRAARFWKGRHLNGGFHQPLSKKPYSRKVQPVHEEAARKSSSDQLRGQILALLTVHPSGGFY